MGGDGTQAGLDFIPVVLSNFQAIAFFYDFKINFFFCYKNETFLSH